MLAIRRILPALAPLLLLLSPGSLSAGAQNPGPPQTPAPPQTAAPSAASAPGPVLAYPDPCEANATQVDFDTCYADLFRVTNEEMNHLYRNAILAFEHDAANAHRRSDASALSYDAAALFDLKNAQAAWVRYRDLQCRAAGQQLQGGSIQPIVVNKCLVLLTHHRIDEIRAAYEIGGRSLE